jgi:surface antigen
MRPGIAVLATALLVALALPLSAEARLGYLAVEGMEPDDYKLMSQAARERMDGQPVGHQVNWRNPKNGNTGTVTLKALEEQDGMPCRVNEHTVTIAKTGRSGSIISRICQKDGKWLIAPRE